MSFKCFSLISSLLVLGVAANSYALVLGKGESQDRSILFTVSTLEDTTQQPKNTVEPELPKPVKSADSSESPHPSESRAHHEHARGETFSAHANRAILNRIISLTVQAEPIAKQPTELSKDISLVEVDAQMPAHNHGMNFTPTVTALAKGKWLVKGFKLHMTGLWVVTLTTKIDGKEEVVSFELNI